MPARLILHGGAWDWDDRLDAPKSQSLLQALEIGWSILQAGGSALDAVEKATNCLEDDPLFDAGTGSHLNAEGIVEMDALLIDARRQNFGAVGAVQRVRHPITLARKVLEETRQNFFVGAGADALAERLGMEIVPNITLVTEIEQANFLAGRAEGASDTVGAVAMDASDNIAVATSTGGTPFKPSGRVGDVPIFGAGGYADEFGGAGATGKGENAMRVLLSKRVVDAISTGKNAQEAAEFAMAYIERMIPNSTVGTIVIDRDGRVGAAHTSAKLACGWIDENGQAQVSMRGGVTRKAILS
ncbi:MAG: isoaspartyl peptidase/L-asparaginase family protein [Anaerolineae bacterium]